MAMDKTKTKRCIDLTRNLLLCRSGRVDAVLNDGGNLFFTCIVVRQVDGSRVAKFDIGSGRTVHKAEWELDDCEFHKIFQWVGRTCTRLQEIE
jgi:hypothetical protein